MNDRARSQFAVRPEHEILTVREKLRVIYTFLKDMLLSAIALPWFILEKIGLLDEIPTLFSNTMPLCSVCFCGSVLAVTGSIAIGLGVGLGVGLNCEKSNSSALNSTSNIIGNYNYTVG